MKRRLATTVLSVGLALASTTACESGSTPHHVTTPPSTTEVHKPLLREGKLPKKLPAAVGRAMGAAVLVEVDTDVTISKATGVELTPTTILAPGHLFIDVPNTSLRGDNFSCGDITISEPTTKPIKRSSGTSVSGTRAVYEYIDTAQSPDAALIQTASDPNAAYTKIAIRTTPIKPGEPLFAEGYGPTSSGEQRSPNQHDLTNKGNTQPMIIGVIALGGNGQGDIGALEPGVTYSKYGKEFAGPGDSGGPLFDAQGRLAGINEAIPPDVPTVADADEAFGVNLPGRPTDPAHYVIFQPITSKLISTLTSAAQNAPACH